MQKMFFSSRQMLLEVTAVNVVNGVVNDVVVAFYMQISGQT